MKSKSQLDIFLKQHVITVLFFVIILIGLLALGNQTQTSEQSNSNAPLDIADVVEELVYPQSLSIESIGLETPIELMGIDDTTRELAVPESFDTVGWYIYSPVPGDTGPAIIAGHVDSYEGPAVFYSLGQLDSSDAITISLNNGEIETFQVYKIEEYRQNKFDTDAVYGDTDGSELRLITCSGTYDRVNKRYSDNLVVFARKI